MIGRRGAGVARDRGLRSDGDGMGAWAGCMDREAARALVPPRTPRGLLGSRRGGPCESNRGPVVGAFEVGCAALDSFVLSYSLQVHNPARL